MDGIAFINSGNFSNSLNSSEKNFTFGHYDQCYSPTAMIFVLALVYSAIIILGVSGNLLLITIVMKQKEMHNVTNILIVNLSFSDLLISVMCLPFTFVYTFMDHWIFGEAMCKLNSMIQCISITVSIFSLVLIAVERHQLIINPRGWRPNNKHAYLSIAIMWTLALLTSLPFPLFHILTDEQFHYDLKYSKEFAGKYLCIDQWPSENQRLVYTTCLLVMQYFAPLCFIFICYFKIYVRLKRRNNMMEKMRENKYRADENRRINIMLISIVVAFAVCWLPLNIFNAVFDWNYEAINNCHHNLVFSICHLTAMLSTCTNPIFYGFLNKNFQRDLRSILHYCKCSSREEDYEAIAMSTMQTEISKSSLKQATQIV
ncbi:neuropeptide Y receptor type 1 [Chiloscyllium plagiosum]|uniref:neuropeptide Y receptor type 1 n=1 Tax=Chiloscyllium plagiosum TaxID=36176 RepID=UPI001CB837A4|nr:neuropeptide Y receptor type 1 [Chiloscyllium plagiosum]XP_043554776.1 neuropeptide Y receptor type 1 [Chiloscyllium plagiosum]XP_043554784.1 neuropeptide Y receptor type 1 [Chiloscyllium plagiosum]XP_043554791.1 neuropeptide Y receptor type 1 [Chiloscyllium plagiosum]XP_043554798.1 neuropeptide Y receptor type 1 [Chiloscyllium plagiosum]XP_043554805.1 neuropeptide Y receptor type 1 [Chiloscyllium plagiosum]